MLWEDAIALVRLCRTSFKMSSPLSALASGRASRHTCRIYNGTKAHHPAPNETTKAHPTLAGFMGNFFKQLEICGAPMNLDEAWDYLHMKWCRIGPKSKKVVVFLMQTLPKING